MAYLTIAGNGQGETIEKKSRFICHLKRVTNEPDAQAFIQAIKKEHYKANHNCSAYQIGDHHQYQRANDDGEPQGTAGVPMLDVLQKQDLHDLVVVVTRYFGGIKLGTGGLVRAYSHAVANGIKTIGLVDLVPQQQLILTLAYPNLSIVENFCRKEQIKMGDINYTETVNLNLWLAPNDLAAVQDKLTDLLNGQLTMVLGEIKIQEVSIN